MDSFGWADLGDAHWIAGQILEAVRCWNEAIQLFEHEQPPLCPECLRSESDWPALWRGKVLAAEMRWTTRPRRGRVRA
jgi:hypothetical protein